MRRLGLNDAKKALASRFEHGWHNDPARHHHRCAAVVLATCVCSKDLLETVNATLEEAVVANGWANVLVSEQK